MSAVLEAGTVDVAGLAERYHADEPRVLEAAARLSEAQFLRLFITAHGMIPSGQWQTHTYARVYDPAAGRDHFFLIPLPFRPRSGAARPRPDIRLVDGRLWIDGAPTPARAQSIPFTTPFWYFHYDPNTEDRPYRSMTLNLKPACGETCTMCAGAKTGRINNGLESTLSPEAVIDRVFRRHPEAAEQLEEVAVVTGCFEGFGELERHLSAVRKAVDKRAAPSVYRVLEHAVEGESQLDRVVKDLGYDVFVTLECFDERVRYLALNGKVGRKGRDGRQFLDLLSSYARYLDARPELGRRTVTATYIMGLDPLSVTESLFAWMAGLNASLTRARVLPWLSVFTPYHEGMRALQQPDFSMSFLLKARELCLRYFDADALENASGGTGQGFARGLF